MKNSNFSFLLDNFYFGDIDLDEDNISNKLSDIFDSYAFYDTHMKAFVTNVTSEKITFINENFELDSISWNDQYKWARQQISIDELGPKPDDFNQILNFGDLIYLKINDDSLILDQIPNVEASLISIDPNQGDVIAYVGGKNFNESNFDRVRLSFPQSGSSFKPFIYSSSLANGYNLSSLINDAPIVFEDQNLESAWRPQNYTGEFYGPISIRDALVKSVNIVSIKLLRELGIENSHDYLKKFGFPKSRLPKDLSLALGSGNFSPAEMVRAYSVIASNGFIPDIYFIDSIKDRDGNNIFSQSEYYSSLNYQNISAFPWLDTIEMNAKRPYYVLNPLNNNERVIDERISFLIADTLKGFMKNGVAGRKSEFLGRDDIGGKTGTTNDSVSTWFSGFHKDLATTVWVGTDDFSSLGKDEYGSTLSLIHI